jgi:uncharacterized protein (AIM24 family)
MRGGTGDNDMLFVCACAGVCGGVCRGRGEWVGRRLGEARSCCCVDDDVCCCHSNFGVATLSSRGGAGFAGKVFFSSYGAVERYDMKAGEEFVVDTGHVVAFEDSLTYSIARLAQGLTGFFMGGEGFVCRFRVRC